ncbi:DUF1801 domain-containing protein [Gilvibacter sp.]|uniref:DUF1801 domain-containing protein n=1 Tax=Gilvibacter sp. TaxID=2729997 RepID=UPI003B52682D
MNPAEAYILDQTEPFKSILLHLEATIRRMAPEAVLKYKYRIPFFYIDDKPFCYLNVTKGYVDLGFWHAAHLSVHLEHLETKGRKVMKSLRYNSLEAVDQQILEEVIADALSVRDRGFYN